MNKRYSRRHVRGLCTLVAMSTAALAFVSSAGASGNSSASNAPVTILDIATLSSSTGIDTFPQGPAGAKAAANAINAQGGIDGHSVRIVVCNDQGSPDQAAACGREAVSDKALAVLSNSLFDTSYIAEISSADIPLIGQLLTGAADYTSPDSWPIGSSASLSAPGGAIGLIKAGDKKVAVAHLTAPGGTITSKIIKEEVERHGGTFVGTFGVPATTTTYSVYAEDLKDSGATGAVLNSTLAQEVGILEAAVAIGYHPRWMASPTTMTAAQIKELAPYIDGGIAPSSLPLTSSDLPGMKTFREQMAAEVKRGDSAAKGVNFLSLLPWLAMYAIHDTLQGVSGSITSSVLVSKLRALHSLNIMGIINWKPNVRGQMTEPRVSSGLVYINTIRTGKAVFTGETVTLYS